MKTLYIECAMGAAGDMLTAALLELCDDKEAETFLNQMNSLGLDGVRVSVAPAERCGIWGTKMSVAINGAEEAAAEPLDRHDHAHTHEHTHTHPHDHAHNHAHDHGHPHDHPHTHDHPHEHTHSHTKSTGMANIEALLSGLPVPEAVKADARAVYGLIAEAEAKAHGAAVSQIHFHEVGQADAVADIIGVCLLMAAIAPDRVVASPVHVGAGVVRCAHGVVAVPAPATAWLLRGVPIYGGTVQGELCTPTGAALLRHFASAFCPMPLMRVEKIGYGMGTKNFEAANCVRAFLGEEEPAQPATTDTDHHLNDRKIPPNRPSPCGIFLHGLNGDQYETAVELCCQTDDMTGEAIGFARAALTEAGALDVYTTPVQMKKGRPGVLLTVLCPEQQADAFAALMLRHTTSFGVRKTVCQRYVLERTVVERATPFGVIRIKKGRGFGVQKEKPEYEDLAAAAAAHNQPISVIARAAAAAGQDADCAKGETI